jgi:predicted enzyme related to lactoylglutathione lyase
MKMKFPFLFLALAVAGLFSGCATRSNQTHATGSPIVYFEIAGPSSAALRQFYSTAFNWNIDEHLTIPAAATGGLKGGIRSDPPEKIMYMGVPDIGEALKRIEAAGGKTVVPRTVVPGVVTFALFLDPAGNRMGLAEFGSYPK